MTVIKPVSIFSLILSLAANSLIAQSAFVSGFAYLEGENNHAGIKVAFNAVSPTAITDSTYTDSIGAYTIHLYPGVYGVLFSREGFQDLVYTPQIIISDTMQFDLIILSSQPLKTIAGSVKGYWSSDTTYSVIGNILVPVGDTLIIEAGTKVQFDGSYYFDVNGLLIARGSAEDSIYFTPTGPVKSPGDWYGIRFNDPADDNSILSYCVIEYGAEAIQEGGFEALVTCDQAHPTIEHSRLKNSIRNGIECIDANPTLIFNKIHDNEYQGISCTRSSPEIMNNYIYNSGLSGIMIMRSSAPRIEMNDIYNNNHRGIGISTDGGGVITANKIYNNIQQGIECWLAADLRITQNDIFSNESGIEVRESSPSIESNDLFYNHNAGIKINSTSAPIVTMNIIMNNGFGIESDQHSTVVSYNLLWNNSYNLSGEFTLGIGTLITVNANGDSIDAYFNLFQDPLLVSTELENSSFLLLAADSPCIDAGGTNLIETDTSDIGSHPYNPAALGVVPELNPKPNTYTLSPAYPNPFNPNTTIKYALKDDVWATLKGLRPAGPGGAGAG